MSHHVEDGSLGILAQETVIDGGLSHTSLGCQGTHLIIGEVAGVITEGTGGGMATHDGLLADVESIVEALLASMAHVDEDAQTIHLGDDLSTKQTHATMRLTAL